jgi:hypothetical protein
VTTRQKSRRGAKRYETNPFVGNALSNSKSGVRRITSKDGHRMMVVSESSGEIVAPAGFWQAEEVDRSQFVKLYVNGVKAFKELTGSGAKVFEVLYLEIQKNIGKDRVFLSFTWLDQAVTPMSESTFMRGMKELISKSFIAETMTTGWYFINPDYLWNGDRLAFVKEYRVRGTPSDQAKRDELEARGQQRLIPEESAAA